MKSLGEEVRDRRRAKNLTQKDLAELLQHKGLRCEFTYISKIENGRLVSPPSEELITEMANLLGANAEDWLGMVGQFDRKAILEVVEDIPDAGVLLRKLQNREFTKDQIRKFISRNNDESDD